MRYDALVKALREYAERHCPLDRASGICGCIDARNAADAIEELSKRVPSAPHGRLIDADKFLEDCPELTAYEQIMETVIEAEEGE